MTNARYIIDRIEDGIAVLECQTTNEIIEVPKSELPKTVREGHVLVKDGDVYSIDREATQQRRDSIRARLEKILGRNVR